MSEQGRSVADTEADTMLAYLAGHTRDEVLYLLGELRAAFIAAITDAISSDLQQLEKVRRIIVSVEKGMNQLAERLDRLDETR